jgi:hypothetical protein
MNEDDYIIDEDFHDDSHPEWDGNYPDDSDPDNYDPDPDCEDDTWADADTYTSIGWGTDEDYGYFGGTDC